MKRKIRYVAASCIALILIAFGFVKRAKRRALNGDSILSIYFHAPSQALFEFCITWLLSNDFHFLTQHEMILISQNKLPFPTGGVVITVDDGWQSNKDNIVAIANKYKIPVTIFVSTEPVENGNYWWPYVGHAMHKNITEHTIETLKKVPNNIRELEVNRIKKKIELPREAMTVNEVKEIAQSDLITIGGHTVSHPILNNCDDEQSYAELKDSKITLEDWIGKDVKSFAYPNGDYQQRELNYLKDLGYKIAYTTKPDSLDKESLKKIYELPRYAIFENIPNLEAVCRMTGVWQKYI